MIDVAVIGAGRLGTALGSALARKGYRIKALSCRQLPSAEESSLILKGAKPSTDNIETAGQGEWIFLTCPDDQIEAVVQQLVCSNLEWKRKFVCHCSGLLPARVLSPLRKKGALTASIHPIQSFAQKSQDSQELEGVYFGIEGSQDSLIICQRIVKELGGHSLPIKAKDKPLYHAAFSMASNFLVVLLDASVALLREAGIEEETAGRALWALVQGTLNNVKKKGILPALTGPVSRGDQKTVKMHLKALKSFPPIYKMYLKLANLTVQIAERENDIPEEKVKALKDLLEEK